MKPTTGTGHGERPTKRERSRERLLDAAIDCLSELGYAGATASAITAKAGLSHGSLFDHFGTKDDLLVASMLRVLPRLEMELRAGLLIGVSMSDRPVKAAMDLTWSLYHTAPAEALIELHVAARTQPDLAAAIRKAEPEFRERGEQFTAFLFPALSHDPRLPAVVDLQQATQLGLVILERAVGSGARTEECRALLIDHLEALIGQDAGADGVARGTADST